MMRSLTGKLLLISSIAFAANTAFADWHAGVGVYNSTINETAFEKYDAGYGLTLGWTPESNSFMPLDNLFLSAEGSYQNLGSFMITTDDKAVASAWTAQGVLTLSLSDIDLYGKLGFSYSDFDGNNSSDPYIAAGATYSITDKVDVYGEYQSFKLANGFDIFTYGGGIKVKF
jgi:hypothetical protein